MNFGETKFNGFSQNSFVQCPPGLTETGQLWNVSIILPKECVFLLCFFLQVNSIFFSLNLLLQKGF